mmetsp:Transcript_87397/g.145243  ORF Transcript_87397/g.145243 Transcript_87397/m.145243 type:complete len:335 (-) Transcript_87397:233-1237(-)
MPSHVARGIVTGDASFPPVPGESHFHADHRTSADVTRPRPKKVEISDHRRVLGSRPGTAGRMRARLSPACRKRSLSPTKGTEQQVPPERLLWAAVGAAIEHGDSDLVKWQHRMNTSQCTSDGGDDASALPNVVTAAPPENTASVRRPSAKLRSLSSERQPQKCEPEPELSLHFAPKRKASVARATTLKGLMGFISRRFQDGTPHSSSVHPITRGPAAGPSDKRGKSHLPANRDVHEGTQDHDADPPTSKLPPAPGLPLKVQSSFRKARTARFVGFYNPQFDVSKGEQTAAAPAETITCYNKTLSSPLRAQEAIRIYRKLGWGASKRGIYLRHYG